MPNPLFRHNSSKYVDDKNKVIKQPSKSNSKNDKVKEETLKLYSQLSQDEEERKSRLDIRDKIIELNYSFFGWVASSTYVNNTSVEYNDKIQCALQAFCEIWWWYGWDKKPSSKKHTFSAWFKPRLSEMVERYLSDVKYSLRRSLCIEAANQLGIHWSKLTYDDLSKVDLPIDKLNSLKAMFGSVYWADITEHEAYLPDNSSTSDIMKYIDYKYDDIQSMLIQEMVLDEKPLSDDDLFELAHTYSIPYIELKQELPKAMDKLHEMLLKNLDN